MIPYEDHLLPGSYTPLEMALAATNTRSDDIAIPIREIWNPATCPEPFLKVLAHAFSVDLWVDTWPVARKRAIISRAVQMHRTKGTLRAVIDYLEFVDASLIELERPPRRVFSGPSLTKAERETWLSGLPQVRVWRIQETGLRGYALYAGGPRFKSFFNGHFPIPSTARERLRRRARWVVDGEETDSLVTEFGNYFRIHIRGVSRLGAFSGRPIGGRFFIPSTARQRLVTIQPKARLPWRYPVGPSLQPVTSEPERVVVSGTMRRGVFSGHFMRAGYFRPSTAELRIFQRYAVHDGRKVNRRPSINFMGVGRYGFPPHTAILTISMPGFKPQWKAGEGIAEPRRKFWMPHDRTRSQQVRQALVAAKRASDQVLFQSVKVRKFTAGQPMLAGIDTYVIGRPSRG